MKNCSLPASNACWRYSRNRRRNNRDNTFTGIAQAPIYVEDAVIESAKNLDPTEDAKDTERLRKWLESLDETELGKQIH